VSVMASVQRLAHWTMLLAGWQLGTRLDTDPEARAVRDHRQLSLFLRAEVSAIAGILIEKGVVSLEEFQDRVDVEAQRLDKDFEKRFPGWRSTDTGLETTDFERAMDVLRGFNR